MNLYLRLIWTLLRCWRLPSLNINSELERRFRVLPNDIDINAHMNNGRYLTILDLMLVEYFTRIGFTSVLLKNRWRPMSGGAIITYRRGLGLFREYKIRYKMAGSDDFWNFMEFEFLDADERICAKGYMKGAAVSARGLVRNAEAYAALGLQHEKALLPEAIEHWQSGERTIMASP